MVNAVGGQYTVGGQSAGLEQEVYVMSVAGCVTELASNIICQW